MSRPKDVQPEVAAEEVPVFPGGPSQSLVEKWKTEYPRVCMSAFEDGSAYIWRTVTRMQWKQMVHDLQGADQHFYEEAVMLKVLLWPKLDHKDILGLPPGVPTTVVEQFLRACGYGSAQPIEL